MENRKYKGVQPLFENKYLNFFHMDAVADSGKEFDYYFVSRNPADKLKLKTRSRRPEGMFIYALLKDDPGRLVLIRQYRYPVGDHMYELPAGLIDEGETAEEAAVREMEEETGMHLEVVRQDGGLFENGFYMGQGYTDESCVPVFGLASGGGVMHPEEWETIEVLTADKREVRRILREEKVSLRMALLMMQFLKADPEDPFAFLKI
ncbi:MAG: NUDIX hydrolase [Lachnospiraceae bacterium]|nr:NUDIX hydrolase [Lachnospiraceae bacterium]